MIEIPRPTPFMVDDLKADFVPRKQLKNVINHLVNQEGSVALTSRSALKGMGGYGKTTLAQAVCHNRRIWDKFSDGILWVTLGEKFSDARSLLSDLYTLLSQKTLNLSESHAIKAALNEVLGDQRILLVIDDVWQEEHLKPFLLDCTLLITTRNRELIGPEVESFDVDAMQGDEPYDLLSYGLANATPMKQAFNALAARLGHWPLLLQLVNKTLRKWVSGKQLLPDALQEVNELLTKKGFTAFDNPKNTAQRDQAVRATIEVSLTALGDDRERFLQLAIFPEDTRIPFDALTHLWGLDNHSLKGLCVQLADLSLLRDLDLGQKTILLHDVIHQYLITVLKQPPYMTYSQTQGDFLAAYGVSYWRDLPPNEPYLWDHLMHHLIEAGQIDTLNATLHDVHYLAKKTKHKGPLAVENDFKVAIEHADETTRDVWRVYGRYAYLLDNRFEEQDILTNLGARIGKTLSLSDLPIPLEALWELPDGLDPALVRVFIGHQDKVTACAFSHNARFVLSASHDHTLRLWERETGARIRTYEGHNHWVTACAFSHDARFVLSTSADETLRLWECETGALIRIYEGHTWSVTACAFNRDARFVLSASTDRTLRLWERETGATIRVYEGHTAWVTACAFSHDDRFILSASDDQTLRLWERDTGALIHTYQGHMQGVTACVFSNNDRFILSASFDHSLYLWDRETGAVIHVYTGHTGSVRACAFSHDDRFVLSASVDGTLRLWECDRGVLMYVYRGHTKSVNACAFSHDDRLILSASTDQTLRLWDRVTDVSLRSNAVHTDQVNACAFSSDNHFVLSASNNKTLRLWDLETGMLIQVYQGHTGSVNACAFSSDDRFPLSASDDKTLYLWDLETGAVIHIYEGHIDRVNSCTFSSDDLFVLSASDDQTLCLWDRETGVLIRIYEGHTERVNACAFSHDDHWVLSASDNEVFRLGDNDDILYANKILCLWDRETSTLIHDYIGHTGAVNACVFSSDDRFVLSASDDQTLCLWERETGEMIRVYKGHTASVTACAFSHDDRFVLSASEDQTARIWETMTGRCVAMFQAFDKLTSAQWSHQGDRIVLGGEAGIYLLQFNRNGLVEL